MDDFDKALAEQSEQGSPIWHDIKCGRFTSSQMHRLIKSGDRLMTDEELSTRPKTGPGSKSKFIEDVNKFSPDGITYIEEKVAEVLTGNGPESVFSYSTKWGEDWEPVAAEFYAAKFKCEFDIIAFQPFGDHAGGSPDRQIKGIKTGIEIKCPYNSKNQVKYLQLVDQYDVKKWHADHYWQCMSNLLFMGWESIDLVTFDPRMKEDRHKMARVTIVPVEADFDLIVKKLEAAVKEKLEILRSINL